MQLVFINTSIYNSGNKSFGSQQFNLRPDLFYGTEFEQLADRYLFQIRAFVQQPKSHGRIRLKCRNSFDYPAVIPNYFTQSEDMAVLIEGIRLAFELISTPPFKALNARPLKIPFPGCEGPKLFSAEYWECTARHITETSYHPSCTCPMVIGPNAVVDPQLKVHGVAGLRVVDASVMPNITNGNINGPTIMKGEKASDLIKEYWNVHLQPVFYNSNHEVYGKEITEC